MFIFIEEDGMVYKRDNLTTMDCIEQEQGTLTILKVENGDVMYVDVLDSDMCEYTTSVVRERDVYND